MRPPVTFRVAEERDLPALVAMLADDFLGARREDPRAPLDEGYVAAFRAIAGDPNQEIVVACSGEEVVGMIQAVYSASLSYRGSWRATLESVRTAAPYRGRGIGATLVEYAVERARARGCGIIQLTTNAARADAHRFYARLGFAASHVGMKRRLDSGRAV